MTKSKLYSNIYLTQYLIEYINRNIVLISHIVKYNIKTTHSNIVIYNNPIINKIQYQLNIQIFNTKVLFK